MTFWHVLCKYCLCEFIQLDDLYIYLVSCRSRICMPLFHGWGISVFIVWAFEYICSMWYKRPSIGKCNIIIDIFFARNFICDILLYSYDCMTVGVSSGNVAHFWFLNLHGEHIYIYTYIYIYMYILSLDIPLVIIKTWPSTYTWRHICLLVHINECMFTQMYLTIYAHRLSLGKHIAV